MKRNFKNWYATMRDCINGYPYYVDFKKVYQNVSKVRRELALMGSLIGSKNIEDDFRSLVKDYPSVLPCIPVLLAVRQMEIYVQGMTCSKVYDFSTFENCTIDEYVEFMRDSGLFALLSEHLTSNLVDYVTGVEVGLDSHARKNRGGKQMEQLVESHLQSAGVSYRRQVSVKQMERELGVTLSSVRRKGSSNKKFDFVVVSGETLIMIETNFYASSGSKLNEVARSYTLLEQELRRKENVRFVWITDGAGWEQAKHNLEAAFKAIPCLYNIQDLEDGALNQLFEV